MKYLLDTHTLIWYTTNSPQLSSRARQIIIDRSNIILISPATYWEIAIKISLGKYIFQLTFAEFIDICLQQYDFQILPITPKHTEAIITLPLYHKDPFDRLLVAQAIIEKIPLISTDQVLDAYPIDRIW